MGESVLWKTVVAEDNAEHHVGQGWPRLEQVLLFRDAGLLHFVDDICPSNDVLKEAWHGGLNGWIIMLFDLVHDGFELFTWV